MVNVRVVPSYALTEAERRSLRALMDEAFQGEFSDDDWQHAIGGWHAIAGPPEAITAHAAVVERRLTVGERDVRAGYVEAVAVRPGVQRSGLGTAVMAPISDLIRQQFDIGALSTGAWHFYERLGWERWRGPTYVRAADGRRVRSADEDDGVMVLRTVRSDDLALGAAITCDERPGDSW